MLGRPGWVLGERGLAKLEAREVRNIPGSIFRAEIDAESALADGYDASLPLPVPIDGEQVYKAAPSGRAVVSIPARKGQKNLLSGWAWPDSEDALRGTVWLHDEPLGEGHVFVFTQDPTERAMWPGLEKLLLNAMLAGRRE